MSRSHGVIGRTANEAFHEPCSWQRGASVAVDVGLFLTFETLLTFEIFETLKEREKTKLHKGSPLKMSESSFSRVCVDQNRKFKPKHDSFRTQMSVFCA